MKQIGVVGLGLQNPYNYAPILEQLGAKVAYVWDYTQANAAKYADTFGCEVVSDVDAFPAVDGVLIDSRNCDHILLASPFIERNIPVYIEKPLAHSVKEAQTFLAQIEGKRVFSASPLRFAPSYLKMRDDIRSSGERVLRCQVTVYHTMKYFLENPVKRWHDCPEQSGGMLVDIGIHAVELLNMFMPHQAVRLMGTSTHCHYRQAQCDDEYALTVVYEDGALGTISLQCATNRTDYSVEAVTLDQVYINSADHEYSGCSGLNADNAYGGFRGTMAAFLQMIDTGKAPISVKETERNFTMLSRMLRALEQDKGGIA